MSDASPEKQDRAEFIVVVIKLQGWDVGDDTTPLHDDR